MFTKILMVLNVGILVVIIGSMFIFKNNVAQDQSASAAKLAQIVPADGEIPTPRIISPNSPKEKAQAKNAADLRVLCSNPAACNYVEPPKPKKTAEITYKEGDCLMAYYSLSKKDVEKERVARDSKYVRPDGSVPDLAPLITRNLNVGPVVPPMPNNDCNIEGPCEKESLYIQSYTLTPSGKEINKKISFLGFYDKWIVADLAGNGFNACKSKDALDKWMARAKNMN